MDYTASAARLADDRAVYSLDFFQEFDLLAGFQGYSGFYKHGTSYVQN
jgi:hypothetical protein